MPLFQGQIQPHPGAILDLPDCPEEDKIFRAISLDVSKSRPRLVFDGNKANLHAASAIR
jgi:hypothetical protein